MGNYFTRARENVECIICSTSWGDQWVGKLFSLYNIYNNSFVCEQCYPAISPYSSLSNKRHYTKQQAAKIGCEWCRITVNEDDLFHLYWKGKFHNHVMCWKCIQNKEYRRALSNLL